MKKLFTLIIMMFVTLYILGQTTRITTQPLNINDKSWTPSGNLANGDTLIVNHPITISGNVNMHNLNLVVYFNNQITFGNPSFWRLDENSILYFNDNVIIDNGNNNDRIEIGDYRYDESHLSLIKKGDILSSNGALPVELLEFYVEKNANEYSLIWKTISETNNDYFLIEKSADGKYFTELERIDGHGNSHHLIEYNININPVDKTYYRLIQYDINGDYEELGIVFCNPNIKNIYGVELGVDEMVISMAYYDMKGLIIGEITNGFNIVEITTNKTVYRKKVFKLN